MDPASRGVSSGRLSDSNYLLLLSVHPSVTQRLPSKCATSRGQLRNTKTLCLDPRGVIVHPLISKRWQSRIIRQMPRAGLPHSATLTSVRFHSLKCDSSTPRCQESYCSARGLQTQARQPTWAHAAQWFAHFSGDMVGF